VIAQDSLNTKNQTNDLNHNQHFIDLDGDGYNDNAPDHDEDGIPNGLDPDWKKIQDEENRRKGMQFVDLDGDGINDNLQTKEMKEHHQFQNLNEQKSGSSMNSQSRQGEDHGNKKKKDKR
jgi:hypothetical protein